MQKKNKFIIFNLWNILNNKKKEGYTLLELLSLITVMAVIGVLAAPRLLFNESSSVKDSHNQIKGILQQARARAISTTSAIRLIPNSTNADNQFSVEIANTRGCESLTKLREDAASADTQLRVYSTAGFVEGDRIKIGDDDTDNEILAIDKTNSIITLGVALGTDQNTDNVVELANNWRADASFQADDLTLPKKGEFSADISNWMLCFNSRGIAYIFDNRGNSQDSLTLTLTNSQSNDQETITVLKGGAIEND